jgi:hypothetical protein
MPGVIPRRPQVRARGGLSDWPYSSSKTIQPPRAAAALLSAVGLGYPNPTKLAGVFP